MADTLKSPLLPVERLLKGGSTIASGVPEGLDAAVLGELARQAAQFDVPRPILHIARDGQRLATLDDADFTMTLTYDDSVKIQKGELDANAAFMQGRMKVSGNMGKLMSEMMAGVQSPSAEESKVLVAYLRNVRLALYQKAQRVFMEARE